jgi:hypothetical protein
MLSWFGIIAATHDPLSIVEEHALVLRAMIYPTTGDQRVTLRLIKRNALTFDAAVAIFSCCGEGESSGRDLQKYNGDNK